MHNSLHSEALWILQTTCTQKLLGSAWITLAKWYFALKLVNIHYEGNTFGAIYNFVPTIIMELTICILAIFCNIPLFNDCALHSACSSKQHNYTTTAIKLKHFESSDRSKLRIRGDVFWNGGFMVMCSQKYTTLQHIDINIVRLQQLSSAVLHLVDAYIRLAPVFRGA